MNKAYNNLFFVSDFAWGSYLEPVVDLVLLILFIWVWYKFFEFNIPDMTLRDADERDLPSKEDIEHYNHEG